MIGNLPAERYGVNPEQTMVPLNALSTLCGGSGFSGYFAPSSDFASSSTA